MAGTDRDADSRLTFIEALGRTPERFDFYQVMRRLEAASPRLPRLGEARRPSAEPVRLAQEAELSFAIANVTKIGQAGAGIPRVFVRFLGLFGPQGPLPLHLTEFARDRERNHGDATFARFADMFHHRLLLMFYRAWRQAQPAATHDRPAEDRYRAYVGSLLGHGSPGWFGPDRELAPAKRHVAGHLGRSVRHPDGLCAILEGYFRIPVSVRTFSPRWMVLPPSQRSRLGGAGGPGISRGLGQTAGAGRAGGVRTGSLAGAGANGGGAAAGGTSAGAGFRGNDSAILGHSAVIGSRVLDAQHHFDIEAGPLDLAHYRRLLPDGEWIGKMREWVREYCGDEFSVRLIPQLEAKAVPTLQLGQSGRLGWDTWVGGRRSADPASDLTLSISAAPAGS